MNKKITITSLFEDQTRKTPDAIALVSGKEMFTYQHLNKKANQMAHYLMSIGIGPEVVVALLNYSMQSKTERHGFSCK